MGIRQSTLLSEPITENRMRYTCLPGNRVGKDFDVMRLANDMNKIGFRIPLRDTTGRQLSTEKVCQVIRAAKPNVEAVCMTGNNKPNTNATLKLIQFYNKFYGANIQVLRNPLDPSAGVRSAPELCDALYQVSDRINKQLSDDVGTVEKRLQEQMTLLDKVSSQLAVYDHVNREYLESSKLDGEQSKTFSDLVALTHATKIAVNSRAGEIKEMAKRMFDTLHGLLDSNEAKKILDAQFTVLGSDAKPSAASTTGGSHRQKGDSEPLDDVAKAFTEIIKQGPVRQALFTEILKKLDGSLTGSDIDKLQKIQKAASQLQGKIITGFQGASVSQDIRDHMMKLLVMIDQISGTLYQSVHGQGDPIATEEVDKVRAAMAGGRRRRRKSKKTKVTGKITGGKRKTKKRYVRKSSRRRSRSRSRRVM